MSEAERLVVIGLGYVGLPLAERAADVGWTVTGLDSASVTVAGLMSGRSHVDDITDAQVVGMIDRGFVATTDESCLDDADVVVICVPTPLSLDGAPDLSAVRTAAEAVARHAKAGQLVILESTTYPGTTEEVLVPLLESHGLVVGVDLHCAFSPERIDPGNAIFTLVNTPKIVGGITDACTKRAVEFYSSLVERVVVAKGAREAEMTKLLENTYRHVNIALVNEMARFCHELRIDLWDVIACAETKPFGFSAFYPGPGVGGHCIPIDPNYLSHRVKTNLGFPFRFVELAQEINASMPAYVARRVQDLLNEHEKPVKGSRALLLGVTYKADIADQRESPAAAVAAALQDLGAEVVFHDPLVSEWQVRHQDVARVGDVDAAMRQADVVILLQAHRQYRDLQPPAVPFLDTRGILTGPGVTRL